MIKAGSGFFMYMNEIERNKKKVAIREAKNDRAAAIKGAINAIKLIDPDATDEEAAFELIQIWREYGLTDLTFEERNYIISRLEREL